MVISLHVIRFGLCLLVFGCTTYIPNVGRLEDAFAYLLFILESIHQKELFHSVEIEPKSCWEHLTWMDQHNYGGIIGQMPDAGALFGDDDGEEEMSEDPDDGTKDHTQVHCSLLLIGISIIHDTSSCLLLLLILGLWSSYSLVTVRFCLVFSECRHALEHL